MNEVEHFIYKFKFLAPSAAEDLFMYGDCYYFSIILKERFKDKATIKYLIIDNHFITEINGRMYDIRGDVTDRVDCKQLIDWEDVKNYDELVYNRIIRDCINF